jgi:hypothetical protein
MENTGGRPAELTEDRGSRFAPQILCKLESAFLKGMNNRQACFLADISEATFYAVCKGNPGLLERFIDLQENVKVKAKEIIYEAIDKGDKAQANWYLERKSPEEFGNKQKIEHSGNISNLTIEEQTKLDELIRQQPRELPAGVAIAVLPVDSGDKPTDSGPDVGQSDVPNK